MELAEEEEENEEEEEKEGACLPKNVNDSLGILFFNFNVTRTRWSVAFANQMRLPGRAAYMRTGGVEVDVVEGLSLDNCAMAIRAAGSL